jgi:hypothetical protein
MVYRKAALTHHLLKIAVAQLVAQVPAHAQEDDLRLKVTPLERGLTLFQDYDPGELWMRWRVDYSQTINSCNTTCACTVDVMVHLRDGAYLLKSLEIHEGERRDLGFVYLRSDNLVRVRVIAVWAAAAKEVWWLATNLDNRVSKVVSYYDRRMGIEEQFRDLKGHRFGLKLRCTQFTRAEFVERMYLIVGVALLLWTSVGSAVEEAEPKVRLRSKTKGARLSLARIGSYYWLKMSRQLRLTARFVREHLPPPRLRVFKWLTAP